MGAIDVDPAALGVDAYAGPGQKWLCGPNGVGFLWLADGFEERFEVAAPSYYTRDFRSEAAPFWPGARRHDGASLSTAGFAGLTAAVEFRRQLVGWSEGAAQMADVRARCVELPSEVPGLTLQAERSVPRRSWRSRWRVIPRKRSPRSSSSPASSLACCPASTSLATGSRSLPPPPPPPPPPPGRPAGIPTSRELPRAHAERSAAARRSRSLSETQ